jgi:hypothetical protein
MPKRHILAHNRFGHLWTAAGVGGWGAAQLGLIRPHLAAHRAYSMPCGVIEHDDGNATTLPLFAFSCVLLGPERPPWEGCRAASKTEYESAKTDFLLQTSVGAYATTGHWWRRYYWYCHL